MSDELLMVFYDVEHGSAAFLRTPNGKNMVIDLGVGSYKRSDETFSPLTHIWNKHGIKKLDAVVITHPHTDHVDDIKFFDAFAPTVLFTPWHLTENEIRAGNPGKDNALLEQYIKIRTKYSQPTTIEHQIIPQNYGGVKFEFFTPLNCARGNLNNHSIVTVVSHAGSKIIIPGDNEAPSWNELLALPAFVKAIENTDILVAAHHGREAGYSENLFKYISPKLTIVSDGPGSETSATDKYSRQSSGWDVFSRSRNQFVNRKCITTMSDQTIVVRFGKNLPWITGPQNYMNVSVA